jgi:tRNA modification GTPase
MVPDIRETIVALSSPAGAGGRAIVRLTGPTALACVEDLFRSEKTIGRTQRRCHCGQIQLSGIYSPLPAELHFWPAPRTYTGQELVELHAVSCPPLVDLLIAQLLNAGARAAQPGEFTLRAFLAGKLDLTQAEAVLGVIEAGSRDQLALALRQLAGGMAQPLQVLRNDLLDLLADVEAGLDFGEEDIHFVAHSDLLERLTAAVAQFRLLDRQLDERGMSNPIFRAVLVGRPNAGKSSLFNALARGATALVSPEPGTTRDYLVQRLELSGGAVELIDSAGWQCPGAHSICGSKGENKGIGPTSNVEDQAEALGRAQADTAELVLLCVEAGQAASDGELQLLCGGDRQRVVGVATKCDLRSPAPGWLATSAVTGHGLEAVRAVIDQKLAARRQSALAPSLSRCRHHLRGGLDHLQRAHELATAVEPGELLAVELRGALDDLGAMVGAVYTEDILDRVFSRFCIGK